MLDIFFPTKKEVFELSVLFKDREDDPNDIASVVGVCSCGKREFVLYPLALLMSKVGLDYKCSECRVDIVELITGGSSI